MNTNQKTPAPAVVCDALARTLFMDHKNQHIEAIAPTVRVRNEVTATIFDDKVRSMGMVTVANGKITIDLDSLPGMTTDAFTGDFLVDSISLGIRACWNARSQAFENLS